MRAAIQGEVGSFSHAAALRVFGEEVEVLPCRAFDDLFAEVEEGRAERGVVPVENSLAGAVVENLDNLLHHDVHATHEIYVRVELCLVARPGQPFGGIRAVASHPVALRQCRGFFARHSDMEPVPAWDTAGSVRDLMASEPSYQAAIASALSAEIYGGTLLERGIEDDHRNYTRFLVVAAAPEDGFDGPAKTSLAFTLAHRPGSLHGALGHFADAGLDLTRLESRPIPGRPWEYRFFADVLAPSQGRADEAVTSLREAVGELRVIGSYRPAEPPQEDGL